MQSQQGLPRKIAGLAPLQSFLSQQHFQQARPFHQVHDDVVRATGRTEPMRADDVGMVQPQTGPRLLLEPREHPAIMLELFEQDLEGDDLFRLRVLGLIDPTHTAHAEQVQKFELVENQPARTSFEQPLGLELSDHASFDQAASRVFVGLHALDRQLARQRRDFSSFEQPALSKVLPKRIDDRRYCHTDLTAWETCRDSVCGDVAQERLRQIGGQYKGDMGLLQSRSNQANREAQTRNFLGRS